MTVPLDIIEVEDLGLGSAEDDGKPRAGRELLRRFIRRPAALAALAFLVLLVAVAVLAPVLAPKDPNRADLLAVYQSPGSAHWLGTDDLGRDVLSRLIFGARTSLLAATEVVLISTILGGGFGLLAGYVGGRVDAVCGRFNDALMSVPGLLLALAIVAILGPGLTNSMFAVGVGFSPRFFRIVRAAAINVQHQPYIEAARAMGCSGRRVLLRHVLPNVLSPLLVLISVSFGGAIVAESALSYLGLGVTPPTATWGGMVAAAAQRLDLKYLLYAPGLTLALTVIAFTIVGDTLRDAISGEVDEGG